MSSIRGRLIARLLPAWLALIALVAVSLEYGLEKYLLRELDRALEHKARTLATLVFDRGDDLEIEFADELMPEFSAAREPEYFEIRDDAGNVLERSPSLGEHGLELPSASASDVSAWSAELADGRRGRALALRVRAHYEPRASVRREGGAASSPWVSIRVARSREELADTVRALQIGVALAGVLLAAAVTAIVLRAVRTGLKPLDELAAAVARIDARDPRLALDARDVPNELQPIHARLADLLARLDAAMARERRFTSAAAHELRTPIAELRALAEVALKWPQGAAGTHGDYLELAQQMEGVVTSLLDLTRGEGAVALLRELVIPRVWIDAALAANRALADQKRLRVEVDCDGALTFESDPRLAHGAVRNLVDNALAHAPPDARVEIRGALANGEFVLELRNPRGALTAADLEHLGEPFWRKDAARGDRARIGLGLAIAHSYARALGGEIEFAIDGDVLCVVLRLPATSV